MAIIQWFPGHMAKAKRLIQESLSQVDVVIELVDARVPQASRNPMMEQVFHQKPTVLVLTKSDKADPDVTAQWVRHFTSDNLRAIAVNVHQQKDVERIYEACEELLEPKRERLRKKGVLKPRAMRALVVGIPNVGKSTLINKMVGKKVAKTGDTPGVTKSNAWLKTKRGMELLDTPGILWPKFEEQRVGLLLAVTGAIKDQLLPLHDVATFALRYLATHYEQALCERLGVDEVPDEIEAQYEQFGQRRGILQKGGEVDWDRVSEAIIRDVREERFGRVSFERVEDLSVLESEGEGSVQS